LVNDSDATVSLKSQGAKRWYEILPKAPGVLGARFSGSGYRGCYLAIVEPDRADEAAEYDRASLSWFASPSTPQPLSYVYNHSIDSFRRKQ
jgi:hypothetical protein